MNAKIEEEISEKIEDAIYAISQVSGNNLRMLIPPQLRSLKSVLELGNNQDAIKILKVFVLSIYENVTKLYVRQAAVTATRTYLNEITQLLDHPDILN